MQVNVVDVAWYMSGRTAFAILCSSVCVQRGCSAVSSFGNASADSDRRDEPEPGDA
jgi:hypothetical protein